MMSIGSTFRNGFGFPSLINTGTSYTHIGLDLAPIPAKSVVCIFTSKFSNDAQLSLLLFMLSGITGLEIRLIADERIYDGPQGP